MKTFYLVLAVSVAVAMAGVNLWNKNKRVVFERAKRELLLLNPDNLDIVKYSEVINAPAQRIAEHEGMKNYVQRIADGNDVDAAAAACVMLMDAHYCRYLVSSNGVWVETGGELALRSRAEIGARAERLLQMNPTPAARRWLVEMTNSARGPRRGP